MQKNVLLFLGVLLLFLFSNNISSQYFEEVEKTQPLSFSATTLMPDNPELPSKDSLQEVSSVKDFKTLRNNPDYSWQLPLVTGNRLTGIVHVTDDIVFACGGHGTILKSDNGGEDWEKKESPFPHNIIDIDASDSEKVVISGASGMAAITHDLGQNWTIIETPSDEAIRNIRFFDENTLIAVGNNKTGFISTNLGETWQDIDIPDEIIFNPNEKTTWAYRGLGIADNAIIVGVDGTGMPIQTLRSTDFGVTWEQNTAGGINVPSGTTGAGVTDFSFCDEGINGYGSYRRSLTGGIIKTQDGGNTWEKLDINGFTPLPDPENPYVSQAVQVRNAITTNSDCSIIITSGLFGQVLASTDSGQSWFEIYGGVRQGYRDFAGVNFAGVSISDDENWLVAGSRGIIAGADNYNAGEAILRNGEEHVHVFRNIEFIDDDNGIAVGFRIAQKYINEQGDIEELAIGLYYTTDDGGQTWTPFEGPENTDYRWHSIDQDDNGRLYLAGLDLTDGVNINGIIKVSDDGGLTWETAGNTSQEIGAMIIWDEAHGYAITFGNQFLFINEEGDWEASVMSTPVSTDNPLYSIDVLGPDIVFVGGGSIFAGGSPYIFRTLNGGQEWDQVFTHSNAGRISGIHFMDGEFGLAGGVWGPFGNRDNILVTEDYGNTWEPVNINFVGVNSAEMIRFNIARKDHIIAYGANGHVVESIDGEEIEFFGLDFNFSDVSFHDNSYFNPNKGFIVAEHGAIFKYDKIDPVNSVPERFSNLFPEMEEEIEITIEGVEFSWTPSHDHDGGSISYELILETIEGDPEIYNFHTTETTFILDLHSAGDMQDGLYQWRVIATDSEGLSATTYPFYVEIKIGEMPDTYTVNFNVKDEKEEPIENAVITFDDVTNDPGDYVFEDIFEGIYDYKVEKKGYITVEDQVTVDEDLTVDVTMYIDDLFVNDPFVSTLTIFPNPASTVLNIQSNELINNIKIVDVAGQVIYSTTVNDNLHKVKVSGFQTGIYFIRATTSVGSVTKRVQVNR